MDTVIRAAIVFLFLGLVIRLTGKREIAQLSAFDLILLVTMGDLIGQTVLQEDYSLTAGVLAVSTFGVLSLLTAWLLYRVPSSRPLIAGTPKIIVRDGRIEREVARDELVHTSDLFEAAREAGIRDLRQVELAVLETDGSFSFFKHDDKGDDEGQPEDRAPEETTN
jgi:uncharacterized membrane protein YcaP (DUF421 family)